MITMVLGGLWHGAAWTFVLWGAFHGGGLVIEHAFGGKVRTPAWLRWLVTFHLIVLGWILFRSPGIGIAATFLSRLVSPGAPTMWTAPVLIAIAVVIGLQLVPERPVESLQARLGQLSPALLGGALALVILLVAATVPSQGVPPFIYFRF
jgi:hypothetical protein